MAQLIPTLPRLVPVQTIPQTPNVALAPPAVPGMVAPAPEVMQLAQSGYAQGPAGVEMMRRDVNGPAPAAPVQSAPAPVGSRTGGVAVPQRVLTPAQIAERDRLFRNQAPLAAPVKPRPKYTDN